MSFRRPDLQVLTDEQIADAIFWRRDDDAHLLAQEFGVTANTIWNARRLGSFRHIRIAEQLGILPPRRQRTAFRRGDPAVTSAKAGQLVFTKR